MEEKKKPNRKGKQKVEGLPSENADHRPQQLQKVTYSLPCLTGINPLFQAPGISPSDICYRLGTSRGSTAGRPACRYQVYLSSSRERDEIPMSLLSSFAASTLIVNIQRTGELWAYRSSSAFALITTFFSTGVYRNYLP